MKPLNAGFSGAISMPPITRDFGAGECFRKPSSKSCTPKLFTPLPKKTGVVLPASTAASSKRFAGVFEHFQFFEGLAKFSFAQIAADFRVVQSADDTGARYLPPTTRSNGCIVFVCRS